MKTLISVFCITIVVTLNMKSVSAFPQFNSVFKKTYVSAHSPREFKTLIKKTKCAICHDNTKKKPNGSTDKKFRNPYGEALDELLSKEDKKNKEKIREALEKISSQKAPNSDETYGDRLKKYQLPYETPPKRE